MNRFWKMKLPAFLLAMVMVIGMVPAASAARADISYDVDAGKYIAIDDLDFSDYFDDETTSRTESLKYLEFTRADDFDDYGYFYAYDKDRDRVRVDYDDLLDGTFYVDKDDVDSRDEYELSGLRFYADKDAESETLSFTFKCYGDERSSYTGYLEISIDGGSSSGSSRGMFLCIGFGHRWLNKAAGIILRCCRHETNIRNCVKIRAYRLRFVT